MNAHTKAIFLDKDYFKLITSVFIHGDLGHLLSNSLMLFILSYFVTSFYGYPVLILITLIIGPLINLCVLTLKSTSLSIVGISGVIYTLWGFWLIQYLLIDLRTSLVRRLVNIIGIFLILLIPTSYNPKRVIWRIILGLFLASFIAVSIIKSISNALFGTNSMK